MIVQRMLESDLDSVLEIEQASFLQPWSRQSVLHELTVPYARSYIVLNSTDSAPGPPDSPGLRKVDGYAFFRIIADELHLLKIAIRPEMRRKEIAFHLLEKCFNQESNDWLQHALLEVRRSNITAIKLYEKLGFGLIAIRPEYYPLHLGKREDALILRKKLKGGST